jgi:Domain of unknown function (DUF1707)
MSTDPRRPQQVRASDAEREQIAQIVRDAMSEGRLSLEEGEERLAQVYAVKYRDELIPLTADLPDGGPQQTRETPEDRREFRRHAGRHVGVVAVVAGVLVGLWALSGAHFFWPAIPLTFLAVGLVRHLRWRAFGPPWARWAGPQHWDRPAPWNRPRYPWDAR